MIIEGSPRKYGNSQLLCEAFHKGAQDVGHLVDLVRIQEKKIQFGIYACSPEDSSYKAIFTNMEITECKWLVHDGQVPDEE